MNMKQTFIAKVYDAQGKQVDFYRFSYKRIATIWEKMKVTKTWGCLVKDWHIIRIFATPDGYHAEPSPASERLFAEL